MPGYFAAKISRRIFWEPVRIVALVCALQFGSCALFQKKKPAQNTTVHQRIGTVALVDVDNRFVLIDTGALVAPEVGRALKSFTGDVESGVLAVSAERRPPFVVADIIKGEPQRGDAVFE